MYLKREEYIYMNCSVRMSKQSLYNLTYAAIITKSGLPNFHGIGVYQFDRSQNAYNMVECKVHIHPSMIEKFNEEAKVILKTPPKINVN